MLRVACRRGALPLCSTLGRSAPVFRACRAQSEAARRTPFSGARKGQGSALGELLEELKVKGVREMMGTLTRRYGRIIIVVTTLEYIVCIGVLWALFSGTALTGYVIGPWVSEESVKSVIAYAQATPVVGQQMATMTTDSLVNLALAVVVTEVTYPVRFVLIMLCIPAIARQLGSA
eukprot:TRINITY_DN33042_c0_g1_i1.p1 TRINITY_DN33042_c0_g1~~TRINITY_DN33042_c0_g1_i1.p1  ORF type:complete len:176 (+),score=36.30 TRINITY_DN33042_c0_g1_i1:62-589(+)